MRRIGCACLLFVLMTPLVGAQQGRGFRSPQTVRGLFRGRAPLLVPYRSANSLFNVTDFREPNRKSDSDWQPIDSPSLQLVEAELDPLVAPAPITFFEPDAPAPPVSESLKPANTNADSVPESNGEVFLEVDFDTAPTPSSPVGIEFEREVLLRSAEQAADDGLISAQMGHVATEDAPPPTQVSSPSEPAIDANVLDDPATDSDSAVVEEIKSTDPVTADPAPKPLPMLRASVPTEHEINERLAELEAQPQSSSTIIETDLYKQTLAWLQAANQAKADADQTLQTMRSLPELMFDATAELEEVRDSKRVAKIDANSSVQQLEDSARGLTRTLSDLEQEREAIGTRVDVISHRMKNPSGHRSELLASLRSAEERIADSSSQQSPAVLAEAHARAMMLKNQLALATVYSQTDPDSKKWLETRLAVVDAKLAAAQTQKAALEDAADQLRKREAAEQAARAKKIAAQVPEALKPFADENAVIADQLKWIKDHIGETRRYTNEAEAIRSRLTKSFERVRKTQERTGLNTTLGLILNHELEHLPNARVWQRRISSIEDQLHELSEVEFDIERRKGTAQESKAQVAAVVSSLVAKNSQRAESVTRIGDELVASRAQLIDETEKAAQSYSENLTTFDARCEELVETINSFKSHINKNVLWIRSNDPLSVSDFAAFGSFTTNLSSSKTWLETANSILSAIRDSLAPLAVVSLILLVVLSFGDELRARLKRTGELCTQDNRVLLRPTCEAIAITWLLGTAWPLFVWSVGWSISQSLGATDVALAVAYALQTAALWWGAFSLPRAICLQDGLGHRHFGWPEAALKSVFRGLPSVMVWGLPVVAVVAFLSMYDHARWSGSVGRITFIAGVAWLAFFMRRALNTESGLIVKWSRGAGWLHRCRHLVGILAVGLPVVFALTSAAGYHHSSLRLSRCLQETWMLTIGLLVLHGVLARCVERVMRSFEEGKPVVAFPFRARVIHPNSEEADAATHAIELAANREQVQRFLQFGTVITAALCCWGIWHNVLPALNVVNDVQLWSMTREVAGATTADGVVQTVRTSMPVTLGDLIRAVLVLVVTIVASRNLPGLLETFVLLRLPFDRGGRHAISTICRYILTTVGLLLTLKQIGIDWASMQWMVAAMTVGLGFGLQEIFANFVSGLIILLERPIRLGDFVTVNGETGFVTRIQFRATTITDLDRRELLVPNKKFITDELINWTLSDPITRLVLPIGIAYGSDTTEAHKLLVEVAEEHPIVLKEPEPSAVMMAFGDSTLNFELRVFIPRRDEFAQILHELNTAIDRKFRSANIEIAFPQCDINVRGLEQLTALAAKRAA